MSDRSIRVDMAGIVPAYQQLMWVHQLIHSKPQPSIMERVCLLALVAMGEIDVANGFPVKPAASEDIAAWAGFAEGDILTCCFAMYYRGWLLYHEQGNAFTLRVAYPQVVEEDVVEHPEAPPV